MVYKSSGGDQLEFHNEQPIYIQIATCIKEQIVSGRIRPGDKLPSVREYTVQFEVSALTIQRAMQYLEKEQVIYSRKGIGNFVREDSAQNLQGQLLEAQVRDFVEKMKKCGLTSEQIRELVDKFL